MKKNILLSILLIISFLTITGCNSSNEKVRITDIDGNTLEITMSEFKDKVEENISSFNDKYITGTISFIDKIKSIEDTTGINFGGVTCGEYGHNYYKKTAVIRFETSEIILYIHKEKDTVDISDLKSGDKIEVTTNISNASIYDDKLFISLASYDGKNCEFGSTPTTITKK